MRCRLLVSGLLGCFLSLPLVAAEPDAAALAKIVAESVDHFGKAVEKGNPAAVGALFTKEAEYVDSDGVVFHGRAAIEAEFAAHFAARPRGKVAVEVISIRPIADSVLVEEGVSTFTPETAGAVTHTRYVATHARQADGSWQMASIREIASGIASPHERLKTLAWLVGRWRQESDGSIVDTEWEWSEDGNFLVSQFSSTQSTGEVLKGSHRIGWDAERGQFRSWVFSADGGAADGWWTIDADRSSVGLNGVTGDGARMAVTVSYQLDGKDAMVVSQVNRTAGGVALPGFTNRVVRQPPAPKRVTTR
ncbi:SnoaL-like domain protein [Caulifigura coniformis]|uniref:SnoaL-like domain protein n=1 Tax=Caulifigura coniformis TaxID=2527983 RepID=A0A517SK83_9PLAN|nr:SgcJ/EcaC family oxidoreductase [Caulifigura coniformis]QDT56534.1 SnoaL-like domain protein [Caulifigura coniformis]